MEYTWLVEKYLEGELSGEELRKFELEILRKPEVAEEVERIRALNRFMQQQHQKMHSSVGLIENFDDINNIISEEEIEKDLEGLKIRKISSAGNDISRFEAKIVESRAKETLYKYRSNKVLVRKASLWIASVSVIILAAASILFIAGQKHTDFEALYEQYYSPRHADVGRTAPESTDDTYREALRAYNNADFTMAYQLFNSIPEKGVSNIFYLYKGITAMELGKYPLAIELFNELDDDVNLKHEGIWYKSLCYLRMEDEKATRSALNEIIRTDGHYKSMAHALRKKI
jgi:hypothetical protein